MSKEPEQFSPDEIADRMNDAVRRALNTRRTPTKELVGKTERAQSQRDTKAIRARRKKPKPSSDNPD
jgi:hypothetical protein